MKISDKQRYVEVISVLLTAVGKFIFMDYLDWRLPFIIIAILFWSSYIFYRTKSEKGILKYWGWRFDNFFDVLKLVLPFGIIAIFSFFIIGYFCDSLNFTWHIFPILLLYPIWGSIQQFLCVGLIAGNLQDMQNNKLSKFAIVLLTSLLFAGLHYPDYWLILGTFLLALFYTIIYLKKRNVFVLGLFHGMLGAIFYYTVVGRDPFIEIFGSWIS